MYIQEIIVLYVCALVQFRGTECALVIKPQNLVVMSEERVTLHCASDAAYNIVWSTADKESSAIEIYNQNVTAPSVSSYISVSDREDGNCSLNINASLTAAKRYICTDADSGEKASAELIVMKSGLQCNATKGSVHARCSTVSAGNWAPVVECKHWKPDVGITVLPGNQTSTTVDNNVVTRTWNYISEKECFHLFCEASFDESERPKESSAKNIPKYTCQALAYAGMSSTGAEYPSGAGCTTSMALNGVLVPTAVAVLASAFYREQCNITTPYKKSESTTESSDQDSQANVRKKLNIVKRGAIGRLDLPEGRHLKEDDYTGTYSTGATASYASSGANEYPFRADCTTSVTLNGVAVPTEVFKLAYASYIEQGITTTPYKKPESTESSDQDSQDYTGTSSTGASASPTPTTTDGLNPSPAGATSSTTTTTTEWSNSFPAGATPSPTETTTEWSNSSPAGATSSSTTTTPEWSNSSPAGATSYPTTTTTEWSNSSPEGAISSPTTTTTDWPNSSPEGAISSPATTTTDWPNSYHAGAIVSPTTTTTYRLDSSKGTAASLVTTSNDWSDFSTGATDDPKLEAVKQTSTESTASPMSAGLATSVALNCVLVLAAVGALGYAFYTKKKRTQDNKLESTESSDQDSKAQA